MLKIIFGEPNEKWTYNPEAYFNAAFDPEWMKDDFVKNMVLDIDKSKVIAPYCIESPIFGQIPPERLSGGLKTLIVILKIPNVLFNASYCGDNCAKWLIEMTRSQDRRIRLGHPMSFINAKEPFDIFIENNDSISHTFKEFVQNRPCVGEY